MEGLLADNQIITTSKLTRYIPKEEVSAPLEIKSVSADARSTPTVVPAGAHAARATWWIELIPMNEAGPPLSLKVQGDVVVGSVDEGGVCPDVNLADWNGWERGVSRRHLLIRPTPTKLFLLDLRSTNGTTVNGLPLDVGWAYAAKDGDLISLGSLNFVLSLVEGPAAN